VTLANGKRYIVSTQVRRKHPVNEYGMSCIADHASYWTDRDGREYGATRSTNEHNKPGSVGGRIWALLVASGIAGAWRGPWHTLLRATVPATCGAARNESIRHEGCMSESSVQH